jgi:branched-chain amino acid transport system ATP-binding protein
VRYGATRALDGVTLAVEDAQLVTIVGPNGAGKTTLLSAVQGLVRPKAGSIVFDGRDITGRPPHELVRAGIVQVPEGRRILGRLTVLENLMVGAHHRRDAPDVRRDLDAILARFPTLREKSGVGAGLLSGGEQQMLAIGRALMARPRLMLLDEPSMGLAPLFVARVFELIRELNAQRGLAVLLVEQNARRALEAAGHAYVLSAGRIVAAGSPAALRDDAGLVRAYLGGEIVLAAR